MSNHRLPTALISVITLGVAAAVIVNSDPFVRLIPADVLRDFPNKCYSWTQRNWYSPNDTWSLKPFCGQSRCTPLKNTKTNETFLGEEVKDCGPIIDTDLSPCKLVEDKFNVSEEFPTCCPVYDCEEGAEIIYKSKAGANKTENTETDKSE